MSDTAPDFEAMVRERYRRMSPDERVRIAASMYDTARAIVLSSLQPGLSRREMRLAFARRLYEGELPEAALIAYAEWEGPVLRRCEIPGSDLSVVVEDDGRVAYAYLKRGEEIVADVWLYNVSEPPAEGGFGDRAQPPFLNPRDYCTGTFERISEQSLLECVLVSPRVELRLDGRLIARLQPGVKPGWSAHAAREGPLARPLILGGDRQ